jgi:hypothetical protein
MRADKSQTLRHKEVGTMPDRKTRTRLVEGYIREEMGMGIEYARLHDRASAIACYSRLEARFEVIDALGEIGLARQAVQAKAAVKKALINA